MKKRNTPHVGGRLMKLVDKTPTCWNWTGVKDKQGYGEIRDYYKKKRAHRVSWEIHIGPIPDGMCICHKCDNKLCINPDHLFLGTLQDNNRDRDSKGRNTKGEQQPAHKLTDDLVLAIRRAVKNGVTQSSIAKTLGISKPTINCAVNGKTWRHIA